jgi:hypothetical protein
MQIKQVTSAFTTLHVKAQAKALAASHCFTVKRDIDAGTWEASHNRLNRVIWRAIEKTPGTWLVTKPADLFQ